MRSSTLSSRKPLRAARENAAYARGAWRRRGLQSHPRRAHARASGGRWRNRLCSIGAARDGQRRDDRPCGALPLRVRRACLLGALRGRLTSHSRLTPRMTVHHPFSYPIGIFTFTGFGIAVLLAFAIAQVISQRELQRRGYDPEPIGDLVFAAVIGGLLGAKIYYVILTRRHHDAVEPRRLRVLGWSDRRHHRGVSGHSPQAAECLAHLRRRGHRDRRRVLDRPNGMLGRGR